MRTAEKRQIIEALQEAILAHATLARMAPIEESAGHSRRIDAAIRARDIARSIPVADDIRPDDERHPVGAVRAAFHARIAQLRLAAALEVLEAEVATPVTAEAAR